MAPKKFPPGNYVYKTIKNVTQPPFNEKAVNLFGVVKYVSEMQPSAGGMGFILKCSLVDETCDLEDGDSKLFCLLFFKLRDHVPSMVVGSIVRLHRLKISQYKDRAQGQTAPAFSCLVYKSAIGASLLPTTSSASYTENPSFDTKRVEALRKWCQQNNIPHRYQTMKPFSGIVGEEYMDVACQLLSKCVLRAGVGLIRVWDGTKVSDDLQVLFIQMRGDEEERDERAEGLFEVASHHGLMYDIMVYDKHVDALTNIPLGSNIIITNIHSKRCMQNGKALLELVVHGGGEGFNRNIKLLNENDVALCYLERITQMKENLSNLVREYKRDREKINSSAERKRPHGQDLSSKDDIPEPPVKVASQDEAGCSKSLIGEQVVHTVRYLLDGPADKVYTVCVRLTSINPDPCKQQAREFIQLFCANCDFAALTWYKDKVRTRLVEADMFDNVRYYYCPSLECRKPEGEEKVKLVYGMVVTVRFEDASGDSVDSDIYYKESADLFQTTAHQILNNADVGLEYKKLQERAHHLLNNKDYLICNISKFDDDESEGCGYLVTKFL